MYYLATSKHTSPLQRLLLSAILFGVFLIAASGKSFGQTYVKKVSVTEIVLLDNTYFCNLDTEKEQGNEPDPCVIIPEDSTIDIGEKKFSPKNRKLLCKNNIVCGNETLNGNEIIILENKFVCLEEGPRILEVPILFWEDEKNNDQPNDGEEVTNYTIKIDLSSTNEVPIYLKKGDVNVFSLKIKIDSNEIISPPTDTICIDGTKDLDAGKFTNVSYQWYYYEDDLKKELKDNQDNILDDQIINRPKGKYSVLITENDSDCSVEKTFVIEEYDPDFSISGPNSVCENSVGVEYKVLPQLEEVTYSWNPENLNFSNKDSSFTNANFQNINKEDVQIILIVKSIIHECTLHDTLNVTITDEVAPEEPIIVLKQPGNILVALNNTYDSYQWGFGDEDNKAEGEVFQDYHVGDSYSTTEKYWLKVGLGTCFNTFYYDPISGGRYLYTVPKDEEIIIKFVSSSRDGVKILLSGSFYGRYHMVLYDGYGRKIHMLDIEKQAETESFTLPVSFLASGMYFVRVAGMPALNRTLKFIKN